jgi:hypothetical protein
VNKRWILLLAIGWGSVSLGQTRPTTGPDVAIAPSTQPAGGEQIAMGDPVADHLAGIQLTAPAGGTLIRQINSGDILRFVYADRGWDIHVKMTQSSKPVPLSAVRDVNGVGGLLELTVDQLKSANPSAQMLTAEVKEYPPYQVGVVVARYHAGIDQVLAQQALVRLDDQTYYVIQFTSAAGKDEAAARQAFDLVLGTVKLLDRADLKKEQDQRLYRTEEFLSLMTEKQIRAVLQPQQLLRVIRDGKDVGYVRVTEKPATHANQDGVEVVLRSRIMTTPAAGADGTPAKTGQIDRLATFFVAFDRHSEDWSVITTMNDGTTGPQTTTELGNSNLEVHHVLDADAVRSHEVVDPKDPKQPPVRTIEKYTLSVNNYSKQHTSVPVDREIPSKFYLPQAIGELLPRLVPLDDPKTYMFAAYVSDAHEVMARYVDVETMQDVELDGRMQRAFVVKDRIGVDGSVTKHYLTRDGQWLGSVNEDQKLTVLPTDAETILMLWKDAKLAPDAAEAGGEQAPGGQVR